MGVTRKTKVAHAKLPGMSTRAPLGMQLANIEMWAVHESVFSTVSFSFCLVFFFFFRHVAGDG